MNPTGDRRLARAGLALNQHRRQVAAQPAISRRYFLQLLPHANQTRSEH